MQPLPVPSGLAELGWLHKSSYWANLLVPLTALDSTHICGHLPQSALYGLPFQELHTQTPRKIGILCTCMA